MSDLVSYYVETTPWHGPNSLYRRRPNAEGGARVDEVFIAPKNTWSAGNELRRYQDGRADWDFYAIHPEEAEQVAAWLRHVMEVGSRDKAGLPPVLAEWGVGHAWEMRLKGRLTEDMVGVLLDRLGMTRRAYTFHRRERDIGLRVLRSDLSARWNFELYGSGEHWTLRLSFLRLMPGERVIQELRDQVYPLAAELGLEIASERVAFQDSWPYSERARAQSVPERGWLLAMWFRGEMTEAKLRTLRQQFKLEAEWGADLDETWKLEWGIGYLPNDGRYRAQLRLRRGTGQDEDLWRFEIAIEGERPPEEDIDRWQAELMTAMTDLGFVFERDWLWPRPLTHLRTQPVPPPTRTSNEVHVLYRAYLDGDFTAETLDAFRDALGIEKRGRIDDDSDDFFGERYLREEDNRLIRLMMARSGGPTWYLSLSYQDTPPDAATVDQVVREIHEAAASLGMTVGYEQRFPPRGSD